MATYKSHDPRLRLLRQFGGALLKNSNAKSARPISTKHAMHVVLCSSQAVGDFSFRNSRNWKRITEILVQQAQKYRVELHEQVNGGDQLQILIKVKSRDSFNGFIRAISGMISMAVTGAAKTRALKTKFWSYRPWSRVVRLVRGYRIQVDEVVQQYVFELRTAKPRRAPA
ncbi:hypothetical protein [Bdellovibrio sp. GT3]|uniref:hypothetical protein n=1 Tax=Bdellovibrio sp. GT3 TaxID=3136282 RepID=UPI0030F006A6